MQNHVDSFLRTAKTFGDACGWTYLFVFDQARNPRKADTDTNRTNQIDAAKIESPTILDANRPEDIEDAVKLICKCLHVTYDVYAATIALYREFHVCNSVFAASV